MIFGGGVYFFSSFFIAPEMINPYYTTYILKYRFPQTREQIDRLHGWKQTARDTISENYFKLKGEFNNLFTQEPEPVGVEAVPDQIIELKDAVLPIRDILEKR